MTNIITSDYEAQLERLLPLLVDYEIESPFAPETSTTNKSSLHRFFVFRGEKVQLQLKLLPKILSQFSTESTEFSAEELKQVNLFRSIFNIQPVPSAKTKKDLRSQFLTVWKKLFAEIIIQSQVSKTLPQQSVVVANATLPLAEFNPSVGFISPPGFHPPQRKMLPMQATTPTPTAEEAFIDFYIHQPKTLIRQILDTETTHSKVVPTNLENENDEFLLYTITFDTPQSM